MEECKILGVNIAVTNMNETIEYVTSNLDAIRGDYICVSNVHTTVLSYKNPEYCNIQNSAFMRFPDGKPLSTTAKRRGYKNAQRVTGPSFMEEILSISAKNNYRNVFYGSNDNTLNLMKKNIENKYPGIINNCMFHSPAYSKEVVLETDDMIKKINDFNPDFIWVGLGAPKQEKWMYLHRGKLKGVSIGVGAAFDYLAGNIKRAPKWMQKMSLEWLYRLFQNPKLFSRYMKSNWCFIWNAMIKKRS